MLEYREIPPATPLAAYVRCFWTLRAGRDEMPPQRILPDGSFDIVFHFGDRYRQNGSWQPQAMFIGELRRPVLIEPSGRSDILGLRFRPGGASAFLRTPMSELRDAILPLDLFAPLLADQIADTSRARDRIALLEQFLLQRLDPPDRRLEAAVRVITESSGRARIRTVAAYAGASERTLERLFENRVGLSPKGFARIARFQAALRGDTSGYFDESHHIHEFRELSGLTPAQLREEQSEMNDHFVGNLQDAEGSIG